MMQIEDAVQGSAVPAAPEVQHDNGIVNMLLLGPTGVGKSTFINSLCNYVSYSSLDEALEGGVQSLIHSEFSSSFVEGDEVEYVHKKITVGVLDSSKRAPDGKPGSSCTQKCKAYIFPFGESLSLRLIDTPGIADTRGADFDTDNMKNVLSFLSQYDVLHAVCILLKPNEVRLTTSLRYSIVQLLEKLHKDASNNILFCFTNSRCTNFHAGETLVLLTEMLQPDFKSTDSIKLKISFNKNTLYFFDSEAFRFQAMVHHGMTSTDQEKEDYRRCWEQSNKEAERLIKHIQNLEPHRIKETLSLNRVRSMLESVQEPLGKIASNIHTNLQEISKVKSTIKSCQGAISDYADKLLIDEVYQETVPLKHPRTVCTGPLCKDEICHAECNPNETLLSMAESKLGKLQVIRDVLGITDGWVLCSELSFSSGRCKRCDCANDKHFRTSIEMRTATRKVEDMDIRRVLEEAKSDATKKEEILEILEAKETSMKAENDVALEAAACFAAFLEQNSIVTYHSAVPQYYKEQIKLMRTKGNVDRVTELEAMLKSYQDRVHKFNQWQYKRQDRSSDPSVSITEKHVECELQKLYELPLHGQSLKKWAEGVESEFTLAKGRGEIVYEASVPPTDHVASAQDGTRPTTLFGRIADAMSTRGRNLRS